MYLEKLIVRRMSANLVLSSLMSLPEKFVKVCLTVSAITEVTWALTSV